MTGASAEQVEGRRIALLSSHAQLGGSELVLERIADGLGRGWAPELITLAPGPFVDRLRRRGHDVAVAGSAGRRGTALAAVRLRSHLRRSRPELIHANGVKAALVAVLAVPAGGIPIVWMKHDFSWDGMPARVIARRCKRVVGVSAAVLETLRGDRRTRIVSPGVVVPEIDRAAARRHLAAAAGASGDAPVIAVVGRLDPIKGQGEMLEALPAILSRRDDARLVLVGGTDESHPSYGEELRRRAAELGITGSIHLLGHRPDALDLIAAADVVAIPTIQDRSGRGREGFGLVAVEAMALGTPVVAYDQGALPETLKGSGVLVPAGDREMLAQAVAGVLEDPERARRQALRGAVMTREHYSVGRMIGGLTEVYSEVLDADPGSRVEVQVSRRRRGGAPESSGR